MNNPISTKRWEHGPGATIGLTSSARNTNQLAYKIPRPGYIKEEKVMIVD